ncbi:MAG: ABC transporter ATP-binding protein [Planctomycetales bacterium]|nr:ABC transporter ATP-binding protein [Planctomycetales bacterium]
MTTAIKIESVSKLYRLGTVGTGTMAHDLNRWWHTIRGKEDPYTKVGQLNDRTQSSTNDQGQKTKDGAAPDYVWALRDINLEVQQGEILGIIGRNGAGKSTLLKLLSRVTAPTTGSIKTKGRIASLLEVGTGFHPELTGRENIYINGAILGMKRHEITRQLDAIIEFSGCAKYLDTPVKRYSSGMMVRLGFAVAAHLRCEILIVDEVLAVGDAEFQEKCISKMNGVAKSGRTVLFVSHNMQSIRGLCPKALLMRNGSVEFCAETDLAIASYLKKSSDAGTHATWEIDAAPGNATVKLTGVRLIEQPKMPLNEFMTESPIQIELTLHTTRVDSSLCVGFDLVDRFGNTVLRSYQTDPSQELWPHLTVGLNKLVCEIPSGLLNGGEYSVLPKIGLHNSEWIVNLDEGPKFSTTLSHSRSPFWAVLNKQNRPGCIAPILTWTTAETGNHE